MPVPALKSLGKSAHKSDAEMEKLWAKAKKIAGEEGRKEDYAYIMGIVKNMIGESADQIIGDFLTERFQNSSFTKWDEFIECLVKNEACGKKKKEEEGDCKDKEIEETMTSADFPVLPRKPSADQYLAMDPDEKYDSIDEKCPEGSQPRGGRCARHDNNGYLKSVCNIGHVWDKVHDTCVQMAKH